MQHTITPGTQERPRQFRTPAQGKTMRIVEDNTLNVIRQFHREKQFAFAHCISGDLNEERQMSAGVAVVFMKFFGKLSNSDLLSDHLAYQNFNAGEYSLITKSKFYQKPTESDYNTAFKHLADDFKKRGFKKS